MDDDDKRLGGRLFPKDPGPLARTGDKQTSHDGAKHAKQNIGVKQWSALDAVRRMPDCTAVEMEMRDNVLGRTYGRRMNELVSRGLVEEREARACTVTNRSATTYHVTDLGREAHEVASHQTI